MFERLATLILKHRVWILALTMLSSVVCAALLTQITFDFSPQQLFKSTSQRELGRDEIAKHFGREDNLSIILVSAKDIYSPEALTYIHRLTLSVKGITVASDTTNDAHAAIQINSQDTQDSTRTVVKRAESLTTLELPRTSASGGLTTKPTLQVLLEQTNQRFDDPKVSLTQAMADALREVALREPLLQGRLVGKKGDMGGVLIWYDDDIQDAADLESIDDALAQAIADVPAPKGVSARVGGIPKVRVDVVRQLRMEQLTMVPLTGAVYLIILFLLFRGFTGTLLPIATIVISALGTGALLVATGSSINIINNILPPMIFIIGVSDSIHMLSRQAEEHEAGLSKRDATLAMVRHTGAACLLTSTTTAVGFISLFAADTDILKTFGWQAAAGVMLAYLATLFFLPAALSYMKPARRMGDKKVQTPDPMDPSQMNEAPTIERVMVWLAHTVLQRPKRFIVGGLMVVGVFMYFGAKVNIDTKLLEIYHEDHPTYQTIQEIEATLGGVLPIEVVVTHEDRDHFMDPAAYTKIRDLQAFGDEQAGVLSSQSLVDFHQAARVGLLGDAAQRAVMPGSREEVVQLHTLIEGSPESIDGVRGFLTSDRKMTRILLRVEDFGARRTMELGKQLQTKIDELFPASQGYATLISGDAYVASISLDSFIRDLFYSLLLAIVIIFGVMTLVFRSLKVGLIAILPNAIPLIMTFGYMGAASIDLNTTTIIIFAISLGLAVDDTIHFLARFKEEQLKHEDVYTALVHTYFGAGRAIMLTSLLLMVGLGVLMFSSFKPSTYFASLTAFTIFGAVFGDFLILPPLLLIAYRKRKRDEDAS